MEEQKKSEKNTTKNKSNTQSSAAIKQKSMYSPKDKPEPNNNLFWEKGHNPLSSKGD